MAFACTNVMASQLLCMPCNYHGMCPHGCIEEESVVCGADHTHRRLVAYYRRMGFTVEHEMEGGRLSDLPHLLVWGGLGTRMNGSVQKLLRRWSKALLAQSPQAKDVSTPTL